MSQKTARADITPSRQRTQYTCMSTSMMMCLQALGHDVTEDEVNRVMGARPMKGASWEQALACAQHYGCRATLTMPSTIKQLREWTDAGSAVMIAWNPEGRDWSHASTVFDVTDELPNPIPDHCTVISEKAEGGPWVWVADPNIPHPEKTVRLCSENDFYSKWFEKWPDYLVRRPACAIEREITSTGRQVMASAGNPPSGTHMKSLSWIDDGVTGQGWVLTDQFTGKIVGKPKTPGWSPPRWQVSHGAAHFMDNDPVEWLPKAKPWGARVGEDSIQRVAEMFRQKTAEPYDCYRDGLRGRELADCIMRFPNDLGPSDIRLIQQYYPGWSPPSYGHYPRRQKAPGVPQSDDVKLDIKRTLLSMTTDRPDLKSQKFLYQILYKSEVSPKQAQWRDRLLKKWERVNRSQPRDLVKNMAFGGTSGGIQAFGNPKDAKHIKWVEEHFTSWSAGRWGIVTGPPGRKAPAAPETPAPSAPSSSPVDPAVKAKRLEVLGIVLNKFPNDSFLQGMRKLIENDRPLSDKQLSAIRRKLYMSRMKPEADHFRAASTLDGVIEEMTKMARAKRKKKPLSQKDKMKVDKTPPKHRNQIVRDMAEGKAYGGGASGTHHNRDRDVAKGRSRKEKHKKQHDASAEHSAGYKGNPDGKDIYPNEIDHGVTTEPLAGGTDVMRRLQNQLIHEQGDVVPQRPESPRLARYNFDRQSLSEAAARVASAWTAKQENN